MCVYPVEVCMEEGSKTQTESISEKIQSFDFKFDDKIVQAIIDAQLDPDELLSTSRYAGSVAQHHALKLGYFPKISDIVGCNSLPTQERIDKVATEKKAIWRYEAGESKRILNDRGMLNASRPKSKAAFKYLYEEMKRRECVVDEFYRLRYKNEIDTLRKQNDALRQYIGRFSSSRKYPEPRDLEDAVSDYFSQCDKKKPPQAYTIPDMLLFLRLTKTQWRGFLKNGPHDYQICTEMAMLMIEGQRNRQLLTGKGQMSGHIADLNHNFDWNDHEKNKKEADRPQTITNILIQGAPPEPRSIEEWTSWYQSSVAGKKPQVLPQGSIDKSSSDTSSSDVIDIDKILETELVD